jgi:hypothetical protein
MPVFGCVVLPLTTVQSQASSARLFLALVWDRVEFVFKAGKLTMDNSFKINSSDLLNHDRPAAHEAATSSHGSLASDCWQWMSEHKEGIGTAVGAVALAAGAVWLGREMLAGRLGAAPGTMSAAERALAGNVPRVATADARDILAQMAAARARGGAVATTSGYELMLQNLVKDGAKLPAGLSLPPASFEGGVVDLGMAAPHQLTAPEILMRATHDGGVHRVAPVVDGQVMHDLLGLDPQHGALPLIDETLLNMRRAEDDIPSMFQRQMPGLKFEMPALRVRKDGL